MRSMLNSRSSRSRDVFEVEQAEETAAEAETECGAGLHLDPGSWRLEAQLRHGVA